MVSSTMKWMLCGVWVLSFGGLSLGAPRVQENPQEATEDDQNDSAYDASINRLSVVTMNSSDSPREDAPAIEVTDGSSDPVTNRFSVQLINTTESVVESTTATIEPISEPKRVPLRDENPEPTTKTARNLLGVPIMVSNNASQEPDPRFLTPNRGNFQMGFLDQMLEGYDRRAWPTYDTSQPTVVMVNVYVNSIGSVSAADMDFTMDIYLRQSWVDPRLSLSRFGVNKGVFLNGENILGRIWKPDLYFRNVKEANVHSITVPNMLVKIGPKGEVLYSSRLTLRLSCQMAFQNYPLDRQRCHIVMGSYSYTADIVRLNWMNRAILLDHNFEIPDYYVTGVSKSNPYYKHYIVIGAFSYLNATFILQRQNGYHLVQTYLPTFLIVMISWVSFWLSVDASPARTTLGVTTLLALTTVASGIRRQLPPVSYIKAVDVWIGSCSVMVFGALLEFALVNYLSRSKLRPAQIRKSINIFHWPRRTAASTSTDMSVQQEQAECSKSSDLRRARQMALNMKRARLVDRVCRVLFPCAFFVFNAIYWLYYLYFAQKN